MGLALLQSGAFVFLACAGEPKTPPAEQKKTEPSKKPDVACMEWGEGDLPSGPEVDCNAPSTKKIARFRRVDGGMPNAAIRGRLAPEHIQQVVRSHAGESKRCYESGLARNRDLTGRVETKFVIGVDGHVMSVVDNGSKMPDPDVVKCVQEVFFAMQFDAPSGGIVTVVYPLVFAPEPEK